MPAFSIPNIPSFTSTTPDPAPILFVPNIKFLIKFANGDLGIAKKIITALHLRMLGEVQSRGTLEAYLKTTGIKLPGPIDQYFVNGKFSPPPSVGIDQSSNNNLGGLASLEKALIQSIFETQKPYYEIVKIVVDHLVIIEDIVAHVLGLAGSSKKPRGNRKALGYQGNQNLKRGLSSLLALKKKPAPKNPLSAPNSKLSNPGITFSNSDSLGNPGDVNYIPFPPPYTYITQSVVYSTGQFDENVNYTYIYKDIYEDWNPEYDEEPIDLEEEDETGKDDLLVLAVYDSNFLPVTLTDAKIDRYLDWIKTKYRNNIWPQLKPGEDFDYVYAKPPVKGPLEFIFGQETRVGGPPSDSDGWGIKVYSDLEGPFFSVGGESKAVKKGQRAIAYNTNKTQTLFNKYKTYYLEYTAKEIDRTLAGDPAKKQPPISPTYKDENGVEVNLRQSTLALVNEKVSDFGPTGSIPAQIEGLLENNFMKQSIKQGNTTGLPQAFAEGDRFYVNVVRNGTTLKREFPAYAFEVKKSIDDVWMDPESEYDMKIIKCDATRNITFVENVGEAEKRAIIRRFIKKSVVINVSNNQKIGFFIPKPIADNSVKVNFDKYENFQSLNIDWFVDNPTVALPTDEKLYFSLVEANKKYPVTPDSQLTLQVFQSSVPSEFLEFYYKTNNTKYKFVKSGDRYKLVGYFENIYKTFYKRDKRSDGNFRQSYAFWDHDNDPTTAKIKDTMELLIGSADYNKLVSQFPNEQSLSQRIEDIPFNAQTLLTNLGIQPLLYKSKIVFYNNKSVVSIPYRGKTIYALLDGGIYYFIGIKKNINLNQFVPNDGVVKTLTYDIEADTATTTNQAPRPNLIRIDDYSTGTKKPRIITEANISNNHLRITKPYSNKPYGSPSRGDTNDDHETQEVEQIYRFQKYIDDVETFYFVEAILKSKNQNPLLSANAKRERAGTQAGGGGGGGGRGGGGGSYSWDDIFGVIPKFIRLVIKLACKLFPAIQQFLSLITNPAKFITDIIVAKLGDDLGTAAPKFGFFTKDFIQQLTEVKQYTEQLRNARGNEDRIKEIKQNLDSFLNTSLLKNYVWIGDDGSGKFVLDGTALLTLFGSAPILAGLPSISFGIQTNFSTLISPQPQSPIKLIFSVNRNARGKSFGKGDLLGNTVESVNEQIQNSSLLRNGLSPVGPLYVKNEIRTSAGGQTTIEEISIQYSTGIFREDVNYEYIYLTEEIENLVIEADKLIDKGDSASISEAARLLEEALAKTPNKKNKFIEDKLANIRKLQGIFFTQPLLDFMLNFVALPLKVIIGIIKYILNFFKSLANPFELPGKIVEFISFKWLIDFFNPTSKNSMFAMAGILFEIQTFFQVWLPSLKAGSKPSYDLNEILKLPWVTFPTYSKDEFYAKMFGAELTAPPIKFPIPVPVLIVSSLLCLMEAIINSFIDFIWAIFGMVDPESGKWIVIKPPYIKICKDSNNRISPKDVVKLLNMTVPDLSNPVSGATGTAKNPSLTDDDESDENTFNYTYNILTSDGRSVTQLNREELDKFMEENANLSYTFNFNDSE